MTYNEWAARHPLAAAELQQVIGAATAPVATDAHGKSEAWAQQQVRLKVAHAGGLSWRNNVGATPSRCPGCGARQQPVRYGLANDSAKLNERIKSSDLICAIPRLIRPQDVGRTIAQFGSIETKRPGWRYTGAKQESGQAAWLALIERIGGFATFSTGDIEL